MTVPTSDNREQYAGNDAATDFDYAFKIFGADDLVVVLTAADDTETTLVRGSDYSVDGVGNENGGSVTYPLSGAPLATGETLTILRVIPVVQETDLRNQGAYYPETIEDEFDRSRMIDQQLTEADSRTLKKTFGSDNYDVGGNRIINVGDHVDGGDAMSFDGMKGYFQKLESGELGDTSRVTTATGVDQLLPEALDERVIRVSSVAEIEALTYVADYQVSLSGSRAGLFNFDTSNLSAEVTADPLQGLYIAPTSDATGASGAWVRQLSSSGAIGGVLVDWYGAVNDGIADSGAAIQAANDWIEQEGRPGGIVFFGKGTYKSFQKLRVGGWATWRGAGAFATSLTFDSGLLDDLIVLGPDRSGAFVFSGSYVFGARLEDLDINAGDVYRNFDKAVIYTDGAHQNSGIARCQIRGWRSIAINYANGLGGPAVFNIEDVNFQASFSAPNLGNKTGIISNAGGVQLNISRIQMESNNTNPIANGILMYKDNLLADNVHFEGCVNGFNLSQNEATVRGATIINATGHSTVNTLVLAAATNNVEYQLINANNTTISTTNINVLTDYTKNLTIGGAGGATLANYSSTNRSGGNNIAQATLNYSQPSGVIQGGFGVSGVVRNSIGDFTITYENAVANQNVAAHCSVRLPSAAAGIAVPTPLSQTQIKVNTYNASGALTDPDRIYLSVFDGS